VSCDDENNIYVMGPIGFGSNTQIDLDPTDSIFIVDVDFFRGGFFTQFNESFQFETAAIIGQSSPYNCTDLEPFDLKAKNNSYYITGNYLGNCDFDPSEDIFHLGDTDYEGTSSRDGFILKYSSVCQDIPPTGEPELSFCENENSKISDLTPNQSYIKWYDSIDSTTPLEDNVPLVNGQTYFATRQIGNCPESSERLEVLVTINPASPEPQVLNQDLCYNTSLTLADINVQGANLSFYNSLTEESSLDITTPLNPDTVYYISQNTTGCESNRVQIPLNLIITPVPDVNQQQNFCLI